MRTCPTHGTPLFGGPTHFTCMHGHGHGVVPADLSHEFTPRPADTAPVPAGATSGGGR